MPHSTVAEGLGPETSLSRIPHKQVEIETNNGESKALTPDNLPDTEIDEIDDDVEKAALQKFLEEVNNASFEEMKYSLCLARANLLNKGNEQLKIIFSVYNDEMVRICETVRLKTAVPELALEHDHDHAVWKPFF